MKIQVTEEHIEKGKKCTTSECPVALALNDALGGNWRVTGTEAYDASKVTSPFPLNYYKLPHEVTLRIVRFDSGEKVPPFEFELAVEAK